MSYISDSSVVHRIAIAKAQRTRAGNRLAEQRQRHDRGWRHVCVTHLGR